VQCPKCKSPLTIPAPQAAATPGAAPNPAGPFSAGAAPQPFAAGPSIFDDAGMRTFTPGKQLCPSCSAELPTGAVLCVKCGYNLQLGKKMTSHVKQAVHSEGGHSDAAAELLRRAARTMAEDAEAEKKKLKEGMPWWMLGAIFLFATSTVVTLLILPAETAIRFASGAVVLAWIFTMIYNLILLLIIAFKDKQIHGLLMIVNPGYAPLYILARWEHTNHIFWGVIRASIGSVLVLIFLGLALLVAKLTKPKEGGMLWPPEPPAAVCHEPQVRHYF
jgi:ribosomal protein L40E